MRVMNMTLMDSVMASDAQLERLACEGDRKAFRLRLNG